MLDVSVALDPVTQASTGPVFSVVIPVFNEAAGIAAFHRRLSAAMAGLGAWEAVYVNDGSTDDSLTRLEALRRSNPQLAVLSLSRNFGKEIAVTAGLDHARGDAVIVIDADLQDPPELIPALIAQWRQGFDIVTAQRRSRAGESRMKCFTASVFYRLMARLGDVEMPRNVGDFRLLSRRTVDAVLRLREQHRMMKGLFTWIGYPTTSVSYDRAPRHAGAGKWNWWKLWNLALEGITGFTVMPLKLATYLGLVIALGASIFGAQVVVRTLIFGNSVAGYPSLMTVILFLGGVQLITLGVIGEYLGRVFNETKNRPLYFVERFSPSALPYSRPH